MLSLLLISIVESSYLIYMFLFFETSVDFNIFSQGELGKSGLFKHLVGNECGLRICPFGRIAIFFLIGIILARNFVAIPHIYITTTFAVSAVLSLMNMNAIAYLLPVWLLELSQIG